MDGSRSIIAPGGLKGEPAASRKRDSLVGLGSAAGTVTFPAPISTATGWAKLCFDPSLLYCTDQRPTLAASWVARPPIGNFVPAPSMSAQAGGPTGVLARRLGGRTRGTLPGTMQPSGVGLRWIGPAASQRESYSHCGRGRVG